MSAAQSTRAIDPDSVEQEMQRNREALRTILGPLLQASKPPAPDTFPRSAILRWLLSQFSVRGLTSTLTTMLLSRLPGIRSLFRRRA